MQPPDLPPLAALRAFEATARHLGFSAAARELNVTHAAVAQQVRALERDLGAALVERSGRALALTPAGAALARDMIEGFATLRAGIARHRQAAAAAPVSIAMTPSFAVSWFLPRMAAFRAAHPGIELSLDPGAELVDMAAGARDIALRWGEGGWPGVEADLILPTSFVVCAAPDLVNQIADERDLLDLPWFEEQGRSEQVAAVAAMGLGEARARSVTQVPGYMLLAALRDGQGVAATTRLFVEEDVAAGRLRILWEDARPNRGYHLLTRKGRLRPEVETVRRWLRRQAAASRPR